MKPFNVALDSQSHVVKSKTIFALGKLVTLKENGSENGILDLTLEEVIEVVEIVIQGLPLGRVSEKKKTFRKNFFGLPFFQREVFASNDWFF